MEIEKIVKKLSHLHSTDTETPTDFALARIIVNKLEADWANPNLKCLDPACGRGTILLALVEKLEAAGHSRKHILKNMIYGYDVKRVQTLYSIKALSMVAQSKVNIEQVDFLNLDSSTKFDVIVSNPPFNSPKDGDYSYWARFVDTAHKMLNNDGYMAMIIPGGWMSPTRDIRQGRKSVMRDILAKEDTYHVNIDPGLGRRHFPGVGHKFTWFALRKGNYTTTEIDLGDSKMNVDISKMPMLAKDTNAINLSILSKISSGKDKWDFTRYIMKDKWSEIEFNSTKLHKHPKINGNSNHLDKVVYAKNACTHQTKKKVILPYNGSKYVFVVDDGKMGCTNAFVMLLDKKDNIASADIYFNSPLIRWLGKNKFTQYNEGALINSISKMDLTKEITLDDVYSYYKLTPEEITYLEENSN